MDHNKDIGNLFQEKLEGLDQMNSRLEWSKLENSLNNRDRKKRKKWILFWLSGGAGLLLIYLLMAETSKLDNNPEMDSIPNQLLISDTINVAYTGIEEVFEVNRNDSIVKENDSVSFSIENNPRKKDPILSNLPKEELKVYRETKKKLKDQDFWIEESDSVTSHFYYYNDSTKENRHFTDKKIVDSILKINKLQNDSINK